MELLTTQQAADKLGVHRSRVHALIKAGRLPAQKFGNVYMIKEADLKLVEERKTGRPPKAKAETDSKASKKKGVKK
jgi:excisionase family DNA binding protein